MKANSTFPLFVFLCLISCQNIGPYRDIEISILNADYATISLYNLPDSTIMYKSDWERQYEPSIHISGIENGLYWLHIETDNMLFDTNLVYTGRFSIDVNLSILMQVSKN